MIHLQCPDEWEGDNLWEAGSIFLGGGITGCPLWQGQMVELLADTHLVLVNPRRENFDITDPTMTVKQIEWEHKYLERVTGRIFWFPKETLCPITLFELGKFCEKGGNLYVGCHPEYQRKVDLEVQLRLARPWDCEISYSLESLAERLRKWDTRRRV